MSIDDNIVINEEFIKFKNGLKKLGLDPEYVIENYIYSGKDNESTGYFYKIFGKDKQKPDKQLYCICGTKILKNYYVSDKYKYNTLITLGSECIKKYMLWGTKKICIDCGIQHNNHKTAQCSKCNKFNKFKQCKCGNKIGIKYKECFMCKFKDVEVEYDNCKCGKSKKNSFKSCYNCYNELKNQ